MYFKYIENRNNLQPSQRFGCHICAQLFQTYFVEIDTSQALGVWKDAVLEIQTQSLNDLNACARRETVNDFRDAFVPEDPQANRTGAEEIFHRFIEEESPLQVPSVAYTCPYNLVLLRDQRSFAQGPFYKLFIKFVTVDTLTFAIYHTKECDADFQCILFRVTLVGSGSGRKFHFHLDSPRSFRFSIHTYL